MSSKNTGRSDNSLIHDQTGNTETLRFLRTDRQMHKHWWSVHRQMDGQVKKYLLKFIHLKLSKLTVWRFCWIAELKPWITYTKCHYIWHSLYILQLKISQLNTSIILVSMGTQQKIHYKHHSKIRNITGTSQEHHRNITGTSQHMGIYIGCHL